MFLCESKKKTKVIFKLNTFLVCLDFKLMDLTQNERAKWLCLDVWEWISIIFLLKFEIFKIIFVVFFDYFNVLMLKINFKIYKKYFFYLKKNVKK
jgi:hypothetical protein